MKIKDLARVWNLDYMLEICHLTVKTDGKGYAYLRFGDSPVIEAKFKDFEELDAYVRGCLFGMSMKEILEETKDGGVNGS